jgi:hypothetical protein
MGIIALLSQFFEIRRRVPAVSDSQPLLLYTPINPSPCPPQPTSFQSAASFSKVHDASSSEDATDADPSDKHQPAIIPPDSSTLATLPPAEGLFLKLKRSTRESSLTGKPIYILDARIDASAEVRAIILKHRLGSRVIYESSSRQKRVDATKAHLERTHNDTSLFDPASAQLKGAGNALWHLGRAAVSAAIATLSLRVTVDSLFSGVHVECKSMEELLEAEQAIKQAKATLEGYIDVLTTFDGREQVV